jgi:hypothetical protein
VGIPLFTGGISQEISLPVDWITNTFLMRREGKSAEKKTCCKATTTEERLGAAGGALRGRFSQKKESDNARSAMRAPQTGHLLIIIRVLPPQRLMIIYSCFESHHLRLDKLCQKTSNATGAGTDCGRIDSPYTAAPA